MKNCLSIITAGILVLACSGAAVGQCFDIPWYTIDGGGTTGNTGGDFELSGTIAQPDAGSLSGGDFILDGGFCPWAMRYLLTVNVTGQGSVDLAPPGGAYVSGATVTLMPVLTDPCWYFEQWGGDVPPGHQQDVPLSITIDTDKTITAGFVQYQYPLTINVTGQGNVDVAPPGGPYACGSTVQLTANADPDWLFDHWEDDVPAGHEQDNPLSIVMDAGKTVTAVFMGDCNGNSLGDPLESASWDGPDNGSFSVAANWTPQVVPEAHATISNSGLVANTCVLNQVGDTELCTVLINATDADQILEIRSGAVLNLLDPSEVEAGGVIDLQGGTPDGGTVMGASLVVGGLVGGDGRIQNAELVIEPNGELFAQNSGTVYVSSGSLTMQGQTTVGQDATMDFTNSFDNQGRMNVLPGGWLEAPTFTNSGVVTDNNGLYLEDATVKARNDTLTNSGYLYTESSAGNNSAFRSDILNAATGILHIDPIEARVYGTVDNLGWVVIADEATLRVTYFTGNGAIGPGECIGCRNEEPEGTGALFVEENLTVEVGGALRLPRGSLRVDGNVDLAINDPEEFDLAQGTLHLNGFFFLGDQELEVMAPDGGPVAHPLGGAVFPIGELRIGPNPASVVLVDNRDNSGSRGDETMYVGQLTLEDDTTLVLNGTNVYHLAPPTIGSGATIDDSGGGELIPLDCNGNDVPDYEDRADCDGSVWCDDCNGNGALDGCDLEYGVSKDCQPNGIPDECDIAEGTSDDDDGDVVPNECDNCDLYNPDQADCQPNGVGDVCDIAYGTSFDDNGNGMPDECEGVKPALPAPYPHNRPRNRYLSFDPNKAMNDGQNVAFKVTVTSLTLRSCDNGGSPDVEGWPCRTDDDCRACTDVVPPPNDPPIICCWTAALNCPPGETCDLTGAHCVNDQASSVGMSWWVGAMSANGVHLLVDEINAVYSTDWPDTVLVGDCEVVPNAIYEVVAVFADTESPTLTVSTAAAPAPKYWADCVGTLGDYCQGNWRPCESDADCPFCYNAVLGDAGSSLDPCTTDADCTTPGEYCGRDTDMPPNGLICEPTWPPADGYTTFDDVVAAVFTFAQIPGYRTTDVPNVDLHGASTGNADIDPPNFGTNFDDIAWIIKAFEGYPYPFSDPGDCPNVTTWP